jgi:outer membrane protein insertion porin family
MRKLVFLLLLFLLLTPGLVTAVGAQDQTPAPQTGQAPAPAPAPAPQSPQAPPTAAPPAQPRPVRLPPPGSPPLVRYIEIAFPTQGNISVIEPQTYQYYIQTQPSRSSDGVWVPYNEASVLEDFKRLWGTNFLDNLWIEVKDAPYDNGVIGKHIVYNMEERQRVKIVDYVGSKKVEQSKIEEKLKEQQINIRLDSFIDPGLIRKVQGVVRDMLAEKGYEFAEVKPEIKPLPGGPKLVHLTFQMTEGPKVRIREIDFVGNKAMSDGTLKKQMKENKENGFLSKFNGKGTYKEAKFEEDAQRVTEHYQNNGYIDARIGQPNLKVLEDSADKKTRWMQLKVPVSEGERYKVGDLSFDGNKVVRSEPLKMLFQIKPGEWYSLKKVRKGYEKVREVYGAVGYWEFTAFPDLQPRNAAEKLGEPPEALAADVRVPEGAPLVDIVMRMQEGEQYFVNRITFVGNTTTRDNVVRRELRLVENGIFNTEALKYSVRRLNQLGYFKPLDPQKDAEVTKTEGATNKVDVRLKFEEQNRNSLTFGAGVSQYEGFFGQLAFQTTNFLGRGESLTLSLQSGSRAQNYQLAFSEPFLFDRPITGGVDVYKRQIRYVSQFTQESNGGNVTMGFPVRNFTRMFMTYSYEAVKVDELNPIFLDPVVIARNPFLADALLLGAGGRRIVSKITPSIVHNTVDQPIFPSQGKRLTASMDFAGIGGDTNFLKPHLEGAWFFKVSGRTSIGLRSQFEYIKPFGSTKAIPLFERLYLGGGYTVRGYDIRSIGPRDASGLVIGGTKSLLFNAEYLITIAQPVRLIFFYDAGQVPDLGQKFAMDQFITSTGAEIRFFMPVLNVPFRLIFAANPQREGVLDNNLRPEKAFKFRFDVGTTF